MNVGVFAFPDRPHTLRFIAGAVTEIERMGCAVLMPDELAKALERRQAQGPDWAYGAKIIVAAGGDGTFFAVQQDAAPLRIPVLCVHMGKVGYLSETHPDGWRQALRIALQGGASVEERFMLSAAIDDTPCGFALNDVVLNRVGRRILSFGVWIGESILDHYTADGVVAATPTGSTAYALSCGGPIVHPDVSCLIMTLICPHTISARPFVLPKRAGLAIRLTEPGEGASLALDGRGDCILHAGQTLHIGLSEHSARFIRIRERSFYGLLREKLARREP